MDASRQVTDRVREIAAPIVRALGLELVEVSHSGQGARTLIRVFIDRPEGVSIGDCEKVHQSLGRALDVEDPIPHAYTLEVSSPGVERPFRTREQYAKSIDKRVRVKLTRPCDGQWQVAGRLAAVEEAGIEVALKEGRSERVISLAWEDIAEARREAEFQ